MAKIGENTLRDIDIESLVKSFGYSTFAGSVALTERLQSPTNDVPELLNRQKELRNIRQKCHIHREEIMQILLDLNKTEEDTLSVANATSDSRLKEYYNQILWSKESFLSPLNHVSILTECIIFLRTILLPGISVILPLLILASPFILYSIMGKDMTISSYLQVLLRSIKKTVPSVLGAPRFQGKGDVIEMGEQLVHIGVSLVMLIVNVWNQISSALHMRNIVADMRKRAQSALIFTEATRRLSTILEIPFQATSWSNDTMRLFGTAWMNPESIHSIVKQAGYLDMITTLAMQKRICFPSYVENSTMLCLKDVYHPGISFKRRMYNTITMGGEKKPHVLLTGPNRGGKSTLLKSLGTAVLMSQTVGIVFARSAQMPVFNTIITALNTTDVVGKMSLFEAEIEFAKNVRESIAKGCPIFLMMDEIFHGTNAHDGVEASQIFLDSIYSQPPSNKVFSVISTHYMDLPNKYGATATQNLCMDATIDPNNPDRLRYSYKLMDGINKYSSVREILFERGLITKKTTEASEKE